MKKYIDRTKNNNKIKSLLNNLSEYSDYHLIKVTDIIVKANNLKKKILEFKSDYIHGYTKIIEGTENKIANHAIKMRNNFSADISNANLTNYIKDSKNTLNIMKALYAESRMKFKNLSVLYKNIPNAAIECAKIIRRVQTAQLNFLKSSGKYIEPLDNYIIKQTHNKEKLLSAGKATWINDIKKHLNIKKTFKKKDISEESINKRLENIYHKLIQSEIDILRQDKFTYKKFLGLKRRSLHFKSPEDFYNYNKMYGNTPDIFDAAHSIIDSFARKRGITEDWGLDPVKVKKTIDDFLLKNADANLKKNFEKDLKNENLFSHNKMFKTLLGENSIPVSSSAAEFNASIRGIFTISRLQGFMASLPDLCTFVLIAKAMDVPAMRSISHLIKNFLNINSKKYKDFSKSIGIFSTHMTSELRSTFETTLKGNKKIMALNDLFFKINLQDFWDRTIRSSAGSLVALELNKIKYKKFNNINIYIKNAFKQNNIDKVDFKCLKYMSKDGLIDPSLYYNIPDKLVKKILKIYPLKGNDILEYKLKIKNNIEAFYFKSSTMLIPTQSQKTRIIATWGLPAGSVSGEAARYIMQFKSFPLIMITDFIENILNMSKPIEKQKGLNKIRKDILKQERSTYINLASLAVATTLVGYIVLCSSYICSGKEAPNLFEVSTLIQSIQRGGFFGLFGDIVQRYDQFSKPVSKLENPASQTVDKIATAISLLSEGESSKALETVKRLGWDNVPFKNISYIKYIYSTELINNISKILDKDFYLDKSHL